MTLVSLQQVSYGTPAGKLLAEEVAFALSRGEALLISGPNGAGKTTLLKVILGLHEPLKGEVTVHADLKETAYLPQLQNVAFHLPLTLRDVLRIAQRRTPSVNEITALGLLEPRHLDLLWNTASGGEKKRALLTRTLLAKPKLVILDEPLNHLDANSRARVSDVLDQFVTKEGGGLIMVSHEEPEFSGRFPVHRYHINKAGNHD